MYLEQSVEQAVKNFVPVSKATLAWRLSCNMGVVSPWIHVYIFLSVIASVSLHTWWYSVGVGCRVFETKLFPSKLNLRPCCRQQLLKWESSPFAWLSDKTTKGA